MRGRQLCTGEAILDPIHPEHADANAVNRVLRERG
jgi:hypothetical protein